MARHCSKNHNTFAYYLKSGKKPRWPWHPDWERWLENAAPILMEVNMEEESSQSSHINTQELKGAKQDSNGHDVGSDHECGEDEQTEMDITAKEDVELSEVNEHDEPINKNDAKTKGHSKEYTKTMNAEVDHLQTAPKKEKQTQIYKN
jgi:hypothetical protein